MSRISVDFYKLKKGDPIDQPIVACIANYALQNTIENPNIAVIACAVGSKEEKKAAISEVIEKVKAIDGTPFIAMPVGISVFDFPPNKYTIKKEDENDTRELIPVDSVMERCITEAKELGFEPVFEPNPGEVSCICIYTGMPNSKEVIEYIKNLPEENPEPTHMRVTEEELIKMMGGDTNVEETDESTAEGEASE